MILRAMPAVYFPFLFIWRNAFNDISTAFQIFLVKSEKTVENEIIICYNNMYMLLFNFKAPLTLGSQA